MPTVNSRLEVFILLDILFNIVLFLVIKTDSLLVLLFVVFNVHCFTVTPSVSCLPVYLLGLYHL